MTEKTTDILPVDTGKPKWKPTEPRLRLDVLSLTEAITDYLDKIHGEGAARRMLKIEDGKEFVLDGHSVNFDAVECEKEEWAFRHVWIQPRVEI